MPNASMFNGNSFSCNIMDSDDMFKAVQLLESGDVKKQAAVLKSIVEAIAPTSSEWKQNCHVIARRFGEQFGGIGIVGFLADLEQSESTLAETAKSILDQMAQAGSKGSIAVSAVEAARGYPNSHARSGCSATGGLRR